MTKNIFVEGAYSARKPHESAPGTPARMSLGPVFIAILLLSLGLWGAIWIAVSSFVFG